MSLDGIKIYSVLISDYIMCISYLWKVDDDMYHAIKGESETTSLFY